MVAPFVFYRIIGNIAYLIDRTLSSSPIKKPQVEDSET